MYGVESFESDEESEIQQEKPLNVIEEENEDEDSDDENLQ